MGSIRFLCTLMILSPLSFCTAHSAPGRDEFRQEIDRIKRSTFEQGTTETSSIQNSLDELSRLEERLFTHLELDGGSFKEDARIYLDLLYLRANFMMLEGKAIDESAKETLQGKILELRRLAKIRGPHEWPSSWKLESPASDTRLERIVLNGKAVRRWVQLKKGQPERVLLSVDLKEPVSRKKAISSIPSASTLLPTQSFADLHSPDVEIGKKTTESGDWMKSTWLWAGIAVFVAGGSSYLIYESTRSRKTTTP